MSDNVSEWAKKFIEAGHVFETDEDGDINWFALNYEFCNGPRCVKCGWSECEHCVSADKIPNCKDL